MYIGGAILYSEAMPESRSPGRYDTFGASHQIFHVFILIAAALHFVGISRAHAVASSTQCAST